MSIEYTIDIQLTELGFPDILQPQDTSVGETQAADSSNHTSLSNKQRRSTTDKKETGVARQTSNANCAPVPSSPLPEATPSEWPNHGQDLQGGQAANGASASDPTTGEETADKPLLISKQEDEQTTAQKESTGLQDDEEDEEDDSDDSDVSEVYEEEEVDEDCDDEEEEGRSSESSNSGDYRCSVCHLQLPSKFKLQDHMNLHTGARPYCCAECGKRFCQIYNYRVHLRTHARAKVELLQCRICLLSFASVEELKSHLSRTHFEKEFYECDLCKRVFTCLKACEHHVELHNCMLTVACDVCGRNFSSQKSLVRHQRKRCHRNFKCTDCTETFTKRNALLKHSFSHLGLLPYTCIRCQRHFRLAKLYRQHKCEPERIHCVACLREFLSQEDFQQHKKDTGCWGNQERNATADEIRCLECGQRFDTSEELKKHAGAHQRVLKCAECWKGFRSALLLMSHMGGHAGKSPCLCQSCGLGFPHQQNYDSHLKTCGQTPVPVSASKKRQASRSSESDTLKLNAKPQSSKTASTVTTPAAVLNKPAAVVNRPAVLNKLANALNEHTAVLNKPAAVLNKPATLLNKPAVAFNKDAGAQRVSSSPGIVRGGVSTGSGPSDGLWKITLNKQPPPGVELVVFLPVCSTQTSELPLASAVPRTLTLPAMQALSQLTPSPVLTNRHFGVNAAFGVQLNTTQDLVTGNKEDPETPLDLSKKSNSFKSKMTDVSPPSMKSEPVEFDISGKADGTEIQELKNHDGQMIVETNTPNANKCTEAKQLKMEPTLRSPLNAKAVSYRPVTDIKKEPQSPGVMHSSGSSELSDWRPEKKIKLEVDI